MPPLVKKIFSFSKNDTIILSTSLILLLITSIALYYDLNRSAGSGSGRRIGTLIVKNNIAQRKFDEQVIWENLKNEIPLYNNDSIRTGELSGATIILNDKTKIEIDESSMIVLSLDENNMNIDFVSGSIQAKKSGSSSDTKQLVIKSKDTIINIGDSDIKLNKNKQEELSINVNRGEAKIKSKDGEEKKIKKDEKAIIAKEGKIKIKKITLLPLQPQSGYKIFPSKNTHKIQFSWKSLKNKNKVQIEINTRRFFLLPKIKKQTRLNTFTANLTAGIYYWRISALNTQTKKREYSEIRKFSIIQNKRLILYSPDQSTSYDYVTAIPNINFSWSENKLATSYRVLISKNNNFTNLTHDKTVNNTSMSINLPEGKYFWRVSSNTNLSGAESTSTIRSLQIIKRQKTKAPVPIAPLHSKNIPKVYFETSGVTFNWRSSAEVKTTKIQISNTKSFADIIHSQNSTSNFTKVKTSLPSGEYYWRLKSTDLANIQTDFSKTGRFRVGQMQKIDLVKPLENQVIDKRYSSQEGIILNWRKAQVYGKYLIEISRSSDFTKIKDKNTVAGLTYRIRSLKKGKWYWRVSLLEGKNILTKSKISMFVISDVFLSPTIHYPIQNSILDLTNKNNFTILWKKSNGAVFYNVSLLYNNRVVMSKNTKKTQWKINNFNRLNKGKFTISIQACRTSAKPKCAKSKETLVNITLNELAAPHLDVDEEIFVVE